MTGVAAVIRFPNRSVNVTLTVDKPIPAVTVSGPGENAKLFNAFGLIAIFPETAFLNTVAPTVADAISVRFPEVLMTMPENIARPLTAVTVIVFVPLENTPEFNVRVTSEVLVVTTFPKLSSTATTTSFVNATPAVPVAGGPGRNTSFVAAAGTMVRSSDEGVETPPTLADNE